MFFCLSPFLKVKTDTQFGVEYNLTDADSKRTAKILKYYYYYFMFCFLTPSNSQKLTALGYGSWRYYTGTVRVPDHGTDPYRCEAMGMGMKQWVQVWSVRNPWVWIQVRVWGRGFVLRSGRGNEVLMWKSKIMHAARKLHSVGSSRGPLKGPGGVQGQSPRWGSSPVGPLKYNVVSRRDQGFLNYTPFINKYFPREPKYSLNTDFMQFLTTFTP